MKGSSQAFYDFVNKLFHSNHTVEKGKFFSEKFPLINAEETIILNYYHFATLNEITAVKDH